jgi:hypothetical protein
VIQDSPVFQDSNVEFSLSAPQADLAAHAPTPNSRAFELQGNGSDPLSALGAPESEAVFTTDGGINSPASMATEILAASPDIPTVGIPEGPEAEIISKDVTLIARGRKKRFRLH